MQTTWPPQKGLPRITILLQVQNKGTHTSQMPYQATGQQTAE